MCTLWKFHGAAALLFLRFLLQRNVDHSVEKYDGTVVFFSNEYYRILLPSFREIET